MSTRQFDCECTTAEYFLRKDSSFRVLNSCRRGSVTAGLFQREATAKVISKGKLVVNFFNGFPLANADYQVIHVDPSYSRAIVASCSRLGGSLIWILSRDPQVSDIEYESLLDIPRKMGFDMGDTVRSQQDGCWSFNKDHSSVVRNEIEVYSGGVPDKCADLPAGVTTFEVGELRARWHILYTQPDFIENLFSRNCECNTVTLERSENINGGYAGSFRSTVACRSKSPTGPRFDFVRPVYEISNLTSSIGHFTQKLYSGLAEEHWQILAYGKGDVIYSDASRPFQKDQLEHMLLYTCLDAIITKTYCLHIVSKENQISKEAADLYIEHAKNLGIYKEKDMRPVFHGDQCLYDPKPSVLLLQE